MSNRKEPLVNEVYYHIYNRGVDKRDIFSDEEDVERFLESLYIFNQTESTQSIQRQRENLGVKTISVDVERLRKPLVDMVAFCLLPNHFHILLKQKADGGISEFMKRVLGGYTRYFNDKYDRSGSLFQGKFKSKLCNNDLYFKTLFCYVSFNFKIHTISKGGLRFVKSSMREYVTKKFFCISENEAQSTLDLFGGLDKVVKYATGVVSAVRISRGKDNVSDDFEID